MLIEQGSEAISQQHRIQEGFTSQLSQAQSRARELEAEKQDLARSMKSQIEQVQAQVRQLELDARAAHTSRHSALEETRAAQQDLGLLRQENQQLQGALHQKEALWIEESRQANNALTTARD